MRTGLGVLLALATVASGCLDVEISDPDIRSSSTATARPAPAATAAAVASAESPPPLPPPIRASESVVVGVDAFNTVMGSPCSLTVSTCYEYDFTVFPNMTTRTPILMTADLGWERETNDFDLYLFKGDEELAVDGAGIPGSSEHLEHGIQKAGQYTIVVSAWAAAADEFTLKVDFARK